MKIFKNIFKKNKNIEDVEEVIIPDLMKPESSIDEKIDLMAPSIIDESIIEKDKHIVIDEPSGIENQLIDDRVKHPIVNASNVVNAFNMSPVEDESNVETLDVNLQKTQKFCSECGTANDILNKYCISCGNNFN